MPFVTGFGQWQHKEGKMHHLCLQFGSTNTISKHSFYAGHCTRRWAFHRHISCLTSSLPQYAQVYIPLHMTSSLKILCVLPFLQMSWSSCPAIWKALSVFNLLLEHSLRFPEMKPHYDCRPLARRRFVFLSGLMCLSKERWGIFLLAPLAVLQIICSHLDKKKFSVTPWLSGCFLTLIGWLLFPPFLKYFS